MGNPVAQQLGAPRVHRDDKPNLAPALVAGSDESEIGITEQGARSNGGYVEIRTVAFGTD